MFFNIGIMISPLQFVMKLKWSNVYETLGLCSRNGVYYHNNEISELKYFYYNLIQSFHFTVVETILKSQWCVCVHPVPPPQSPPPSSEALGGALCSFHADLVISFVKWQLTRLQRSPWPTKRPRKESRLRTTIVLIWSLRRRMVLRCTWRSRVIHSKLMKAYCEW